MRRTSYLVPLVLVGALTLSACEGEAAQFEDDPGSSASQAEDNPQDAAQEDQPDDGGQESASADAEDEADVEADSAAAAGVDVNDVGEPLATATIPATVQGDEDATLEVAVHSMVRDGDVVHGTFSFQVQSDARGVAPAWIYSYLGSRSWQPYFVDTVNLTRHDVVSGTGVKAATSSQEVKFLPGQTIYGYAVFAAPPPDVTAVTLSLVEGTPTVEVELR